MKIGGIVDSYYKLYYNSPEMEQDKIKALIRIAKNIVCCLTMGTRRNFDESSITSVKSRYKSELAPIEEEISPIVEPLEWIEYLSKQAQASDSLALKTRAREAFATLAKKKLIQFGYGFCEMWDLQVEEFSESEKETDHEETNKPQKTATASDKGASQLAHSGECGINEILDTDWMDGETNTQSEEQKTEGGEEKLKPPPKADQSIESELSDDSLPEIKKITASSVHRARAAAANSQSASKPQKPILAASGTASTGQAAYNRASAASKQVHFGAQQPIFNQAFGYNDRTPKQSHYMDMSDKHGLLMKGGDAQIVQGTDGYSYMRIEPDRFQNERSRAQSDHSIERKFSLAMRSNKSVQMDKLGVDGPTTVKKWFENFELKAREIPEERWAFEAYSHFDDNVLDVYKEMEYGETNYRMIKQFMIRELTPLGYNTKVINDFFGAKQKPDESVDAFARRLKRYIREANVEDRQSMTQKLTATFAAGLNPEITKCTGVLDESMNFDEARGRAKHVEDREREALVRRQYTINSVQAEESVNAVAKPSRCFKCDKEGHRASECKEKCCSHCGGKHIQAECDVFKALIKSMIETGMRSNRPQYEKRTFHAAHGHTSGNSSQNNMKYQSVAPSAGNRQSDRKYEQNSSSDGNRQFRNNQNSKYSQNRDSRTLDKCENCGRIGHKTENCRSQRKN